MGRFAPRGTGNASPFGATEGVVFLAAAIETILVAGLILRASRVGAGSATVALFSRLNDLLLSPLTLLFEPGASTVLLLVQQSAAILGYGLFFLLIIGVASWLDRR